MTAISVVVIDDQDLVRAGLASLLDGTDHITVVGQAGNGEEGVRLVRAVRPDVALVDIRMPVLNGIDAVARIRADPACAGTRLVVLTTFGLDEYVFGAIRAGADGFLLKDAEPDELVRCVRLVAQGDAVMSPSVTRTLLDDYLTRRTSHQRRAAPALTDRERDVLDGVRRGLSNKAIAADLCVGAATVKSYVSRLLERFGTQSRVGLVIAAYECGLVDTR
ncbi:response regulator transcription factor [Kribbella sp. NBC_01245]|uniref:response regulator transcription factor n=1 Tax=Kribbella sp. NBC_01245 TaxID=2903578 RepID=UPI002E2B48BD|nr:response regulator transcription factor [Kribbella sp. NBC_01245]